MADDNPQILQQLDDDSVKWQRCAICDEQRLSVKRTAGRPDFALCGHCNAAYVLEKGGKMRMFYGNIPLTMPKTREFALKQWRSIVEVRAKAEQERVAKKNPDYVPNALQGDNPLISGVSRDDHMDAILRLEQEKSAIFYDRVKKVEPPPRPLRETGQLPSIDHLFEIDDL